MSVTVIESEITLYIKIQDPGVLDSADEIEDHIQLENTFITGARERVRQITPIKGPGLDVGVHFEKTLKDKRANDAGIPSAFETNEVTDRNGYEAFAQAAERAVLKRRYLFVGGKPTIEDVPATAVLPALRYEVDRFIIPTTKKFSEWYKVDIELTEIIDALKEQGFDPSNLRTRLDLSGFPLVVIEGINPAAQTPEQRATLDKLWKEEFAINVREPVYAKIAKPTV